MNETLRQTLSEIKDRAGRLDALLQQRGGKLPDLIAARALVRLDRVRAVLDRLAHTLIAAGSSAGRKDGNR